LTLFDEKEREREAHSFSLLSWEEPTRGWTGQKGDRETKHGGGGTIYRSVRGEKAGGKKRIARVFSPLVAVIREGKRLTR